MRESLLGLDLAEAFHRYLAWSETTTDVRHVQHRCDELLEHIIDELKVSNMFDMFSKDMA